MKGKHWYTFKGGYKQLNQISWDTLRNDANEKEFYIEEEIEEYELNCKRKNDYGFAAEEIVKFLIKNNLRRIVSMGVGKGILEWHLKEKCPSIEISCTDYTEKALKKLQAVFPTAKAFRVFDMVEGDWGEFREFEDVVFYRVSTEFNAETWRDIFIKCYNAEIGRIIFCPTRLDTYKTVFKELKRHCVNKLRKRQDAFCGWLYTENEFFKMWKGLYLIEETIDISFSKIYFLKRK